MTDKPIKDLTLTELIDKLLWWGMVILFGLTAGTGLLVFLLDPSAITLVLSVLFALAARFCEGRATA